MTKPGRSMAGLLATRVLADHYDRVTLVERDVVPQNRGGRKKPLPENS